MTPHIIAHRGDSSRRPENTLAAFASALEAGAEIVELDVRVTRDARVVVLHDSNVDRTTNGSGSVHEMTLEEIRRLSAGFPDRFENTYAGERIPTLAEALAFMRDRAKVVIEIKPHVVGEETSPDGIEAETLTEVHRARMVPNAAIVSFDSRVLRRCREMDPAVARGHLFYRADTDDVLEAAESVGADFILPEKGMLSLDLCARARAAGLKVGSWLVENPEELERLREYSLFGVGTNHPGLIIDVLAGA